MVSHDGGDFLPRTLAALAAQTRPADTCIGVDTGSRDHSAALLRTGLRQRQRHRLRPGPQRHGRRGAGRTQRPGPRRGRRRRRGRHRSGRAEWIWLLHDDAAPAPEALAELLHAVERAPSVTVAGCKQLDWHSERRLIDVGLSTSRWAERLTLIDADELDQGQYDGRSDTFAVNSAGMLVRRDVWEDLRGFDPALPGTGDDVDFCWRNRLAGHRVVVVPSARMFHVSHRPNALGNASAARKAQVHLRLKHAAAWKVPLHAVGALLGSLFKLVLSIAVKDPGHGFSQLLATFGALGRPAAVIRGRRNAARTRRIRRSVIKGLQTPRREVWAHRRSLMEAIGADDSGEPLTGNHPLADQPTGDSADDFAALTTSERGWVGNGALLAVLITTAASLIGLLSLFRAEAVSGGALIPVSPRLGEIWNHASGWWITLGAGLPGHGDPFALRALDPRRTRRRQRQRCAWLAADSGDAALRPRRMVRRRRPDAAPPPAPGRRPRLGRRAGPAGGPQPGPRRSPHRPCDDAAAGTRPAAGHRHRRGPRPLRGSGARGTALHRSAAGQARNQRHTLLDRRRRGRPGAGRRHRGSPLAAAARRRPRGALRHASGPPRPHRVVGAAAQPCAVCAVRCLDP